MEEGQHWPLPLRPPPFHTRRQNRNFTNTTSKRIFPLPSPIVISPNLHAETVDVELGTMSNGESTMHGMI
jgi:hypothetical protein